MTTSQPFRLSSDNAMKRLKRRQAPSPNSILDRRALEQALDEQGIVVKKAHLDGFYQMLHRQQYPELDVFVTNYLSSNVGKSSHDSMPLCNVNKKNHHRNVIQLPKAFLAYLQSTRDFCTLTSRVAYKTTSSDQTTKLVLELHDGQHVESVLMRYVRPSVDARKNGASRRASLCVSSQCGCAMGCTFCATGTMGWSGNLTTGEILEQMVHAERVLAEEYKENAVEQLDLVRNVIFMGQGEPLDNYSNVLEACRALIDPKRWNLAHGRVTVSTVGIVSKIYQLTRDLPEISLALSLHAPNQEMRTKIVPTARQYPIQDLIDAVDNHMMAYVQKKKRNRSSSEDYTTEERVAESSRRRVMIEYVMLEGETSSFECAHQLGKLCENRHMMVNLIRYNPTDVRDKLRCPSDEHLLKFRDIVQSYGTFCSIRRTMGADIDSACGQLANLLEENNSTTKDEPVDIEDVVGGAVVPKKAVAVRKQHKQQIDAMGNNTREKGANGSTASEDLSSSTNYQWMIPSLVAATTVCATLFVLSSFLYLKQRRR